MSSVAASARLPRLLLNVSLDIWAKKLDILGLDIWALKLFVCLGIVIVPESSSDDDVASMAAAANGFNQLGLKSLLGVTRKRFPIFVGRRSEESNEEIDDWGKLEEDKRAGGHLFVGRRAPPIFVGKKGTTRLNAFNET